MNGIGDYLSLLATQPGQQTSQTPDQQQAFSPQSYLQWLVNSQQQQGGGGVAGKSNMSGMGTALAGSMGVGPLAGL